MSTEEGRMDLPLAESQAPGATVRVQLTAKSIWLAIGSVFLALALLWMISRAWGLVSMLIISFFFSLALQPAVTWLHRRYGWRRGAAVGFIYLAGILFAILMVVVMIPAIVELATRIGESGAEWLNNVNDWFSSRFGFEIFSQSEGDRAASATSESMNEWANSAFGALVGIASKGVGLVFNLATIAMFTFYLTADAGRIQRALLQFFNPRRQKYLGWLWDEAIVQTGGYFYSRTILMFINGMGFFFTMVLVGVPTTIALSLALFGGFVSVFIPAIGTYIGGAVPILVTLAIQGLVPGLIVLGFVLVYQQIENYWLAPKISSNTMELNGGVAFGAALAGGAIAGPMGAFMALPVAALITALMSNIARARSQEVVFRSSYDDEEEEEEATESTGAME